ncbi:MAG TPA: hypothetical protein VMJ31_03220 [Methylocystis sp.]|nr:hypothetical protein [Methylocystis sp.]
MIEAKTLRRASAFAAVFGCGVVIVPPGDALAQTWTEKPAQAAPAPEGKAETAQSPSAEQGALHRLALKYIGLKDLMGAKKAAAQKAYDAEKENFLKSYEPTYARDKAAYQAAGEEYETKRKAVWQGALDELKAQGYELNGTKLEGEDLQYRKRPVEEDLAGSSAVPKGELNEGYLAIVNKYVQSNAEIQDLGARRLQAYKALAAHQDALIEKIDAEVPAASREAAQPAKTAPLEPAKPAAQEPAKPVTQAPVKPAAEAPAQPGAMEPTQPLVEAPAKPPAQESAKPSVPAPSGEPATAPPRPPELRTTEKRPTLPAARPNAAAEPVAPVAHPAPQAETSARQEIPREALEKPAPLREARAAKSSEGALPPLPALPRLPKEDEDGLPPRPEAPTPPGEEETAGIPAPTVAPLAVATPQAMQWRIGVFGSVTWAQPNLSWTGPGGGALAPFAASSSLDRSFGGGGAQVALRLRPFYASWLQRLAVGLAADVAGRAGGAQGGLSPFVSTSFSSRLQATQRLEVGYDIDVGGTTVVTPFATVGFSEAQFAVSNHGAVLGNFAWGSASDFKLGATYGGGLELKVLGAATLQLLYLRHEYNPAAAAIWGGAVGGVFVGARKGLAENELRVGVVIPLPRPW